MNREISIIGKTGDLASALEADLSTNNQIQSFSKEQVNMLDANTISQIIPLIKNSDVIIICSGVMTGNVRDMLDINSVGQIQLLSELANSDSRSHVIVIGSHAATWTSWPNIELNRLLYNTSKNMLQEFVLGLEHSNLSKLQLSLYNVSRFNSKFSGMGGGVEIKEVVDKIKWLIDQTNPPLLIEEGKLKIVN